MKDYSLNLEERRDFILGYDITKDGMIKIKFAKGKPWYIPYNEENEKKLLDKMKKQLENSVEIKEKIMSKLLPTTISSAALFATTIIVVINLAGSYNTYVEVGISSLLMGASLITGFFAIKNGIKLNDLKKNVKFLEMVKKLNDNVRSEKNVLVNVSNKTKKAIKKMPEDRPVFDINSFNYVPFKDLEQIIDNVERNEKFGFVYDEQPKRNTGKTRKRKMENK